MRGGFWQGHWLSGDYLLLRRGDKVGGEPTYHGYSPSDPPMCERESALFMQKIGDNLLDGQSQEAKQVPMLSQRENQSLALGRPTLNLGISGWLKQKLIRRVKEQSGDCSFNIDVEQVQKESIAPIACYTT